MGNWLSEVWDNEGGFAWDVPILLAIHSTANPLVDFLAVMLTRVRCVLGRVSSCYCHRVGAIRSPKVAIAHLSDNYFIGQYRHQPDGKSVIASSAPPFVRVTRTPSLTMGILAVMRLSCMSLVAVLVILSWGSRWRWWVLAIGIIFVLVIGWTRLYLGVHYQARHFSRLDGFDRLGSWG